MLSAAPDGPASKLRFVAALLHSLALQGLQAGFLWSHLGNFWQLCRKGFNQSPLQV